MSDQENASQDEELQEQDEADVEGHRATHINRNSAGQETEEPDVEAHRATHTQRATHSQ